MIPLVSKIRSINIVPFFFRAEKRGSSVHCKSYYDNLSRNISYALRHNPDACGLKMDEHGFVPLESLLGYLKLSSRWKTVSESDIVSIVRNSEKKRFQLDNHQIRAYYGHSFSRKIDREPQIPPKMLFHGTYHGAVESILKEGLTPQSRQYVHLSSSRKTAMSVGKRRDDNPVIFKIDARKANGDGINFYAGNQDVWLADNIPPQYIAIC